MNPAVAARVGQLATQAEHRRAIAEFRARHAADQQACVNALLLQAIAALADLLGAPRKPGPGDITQRGNSRQARATRQHHTSSPQSGINPAVPAKPC